jgi:hypothetical protein
MTKKPDWADEMARREWTMSASLSTIAAAFRKNKAEGMREAAELIHLRMGSDAAEAVILAIETRADEIEAGIV